MMVDQFEKSFARFFDPEYGCRAAGTEPLTDGSRAGRRKEPAMSIVGEGVALSPRQCGRCRKFFDGDSALHPTALPAWWLCPPCRIALLGDDQTSVGTHHAH